jgi:hypothetical protein
MSSTYNVQGQNAMVGFIRAVEAAAGLPEANIEANDTWICDYLNACFPEATEEPVYCTKSDYWSYLTVECENMAAVRFFASLIE